MNNIRGNIDSIVINTPTQKNYDEEKCIVCGNLIKFRENEYKKRCGRCGTWVLETRKAVQRSGGNIKCFTCLDAGIIEYPVQKERKLYKYVARCSCPKGMTMPNTIPLLEKCEFAPNAGYFEHRNRKMYKKG